MASLTQWEKSQLESVHLLLEQAKAAIGDLEEKDKALRSGRDVDASRDWLKFRGITFDLYSVLDYTFFLLHCHFSNKGQPDLSRKTSHLGIPSKPTGVKTSSTAAHDQSKKFEKEKLQSLWGSKLGEETHFWQEIGEVILGMQPKLEVDGSGAVIGGGEPTIAPGDQESFALLHSFRNCAAHKDLIRFVPKKSWVEIDQCTREVKLVRERREQQGFFYYELDRGYWVHLPDSIAGREPDGYGSRLLMDVLQQLMNFVTKVSSKLLCSSLLLPPAWVLLRQHFKECRMETKFKPAEGVVEVTTRHGEKLVQSFGQRKPQVDTEACIRILQELAKKRIFPDRPYSFFNLHHVRPYPPVQVLEKKPSKTYRMLVNEYGQRLDSIGLTLKLDWDGPKPVKDRNQHYVARVNLSITSADGDVVVQLCSAEHEELGKDKPKEAAVAEVTEECVRLGLIQLI